MYININLYLYSIITSYLEPGTFRLLTQHRSTELRSLDTDK
jgi:hypothetical protein